jgi:hypothetical protein
MDDINSTLRNMLVERLRSVSLIQVAEESGIDRACLSLFRYKQRDLSKANIEKLRVYFRLGLTLVPLSGNTTISDPTVARL